MSRIVFLLLMLIPIVTIGNEIIPQHIRTSTLSGTLYSTHFYQGGAMTSDDFVQPLPLANFQLWVVKLNEQDSIPEVLFSFTSDENGKFRVQLPPGKYGFVTSEDIGNLEKGQCFPKNSQSGDLAEMTILTWECNMALPLELDVAWIENIVITYHSRSYCNLCP